MYPDEEDFEEVYNGEGREDLVDNDAISSEEEAFMHGYDEDRENTDNESVEDKVYEDAFEKKTRRSKRRQESFDEEELEAEVTLH
ncbi:hypothetical protein K9M74_00765 [Candidatus Woesearchaeota archaeon]|nr:hypothetical protein [Candidatus Woesearchaeota archaeon]